jgi:4-hydroxymandelate oxidase
VRQTRRVPQSPLDREADARAIVSAAIADYVATGAGDEQTVVTNRDAWGHWWLRPRVLRDVADVDLTTTMLGTEVASPVVVAPTGYQRQVHRDGEVGTARAAAEAGALFVLSTRASCRLEDVAAVAGPWWLQVYVLRDRGITDEVVRRSAEAGASALVLTGDTPVVSSRTRPSNFDFSRAATMARELTGVRDDAAYQQAPDVTYDEISRLREVSGGLPVVVKGVLRADDARACLDAGAAAVWVSNHGGRQLDGVVPTAHALPEVVEAVGAFGGEAEVYVDGGVRHGRDVLRALALGARGVGLGRAVLWALAADGGRGVADLLQGFEANLVETLRLAGVRSPHETSSDLVTLDFDL